MGLAASGGKVRPHALASRSSAAWPDVSRSVVGAAGIENGELSPPVRAVPSISDDNDGGRGDLGGLAVTTDVATPCYTDLAEQLVDAVLAGDRTAARQIARAMRDQAMPKRTAGL